MNFKIKEKGDCMYKEMFLKRIDLEQTEITLKSLPLILRHTANAIPFENLRILNGTAYQPTVENSVQKIIVEQEGGVCYEINVLLYGVLKECGLDVSLMSATVYDAEAEAYAATGETHVVVILREGERSYVIDSGFGNNIPLIPVPLTGDVVSTTNGSFRFDGDHFMMKRVYRDSQFIKGYTLTGKSVDAATLRNIQSIIEKSEQSLFNKAPLITKCTETGTLTCAKGQLIQMKNGHKTITPLTENEALNPLKLFIK